MSSLTALPHILLIGSTGRLGRLVLTNAISREHKITALARNPSTLAELTDTLPSAQRTSLNIVAGNPTSESDLSQALAQALNNANNEQLVILSTLGQTRKSGNPWSAVTSPAMFMTESARALLRAIRKLPFESQKRIEKLILISMFGVESSFLNLHFLIKPVMLHSNMSQTLEDHNALDAIVRGQNDVNWVMVRPTMLKDGGEMVVKVRGQDGTGEGWMPSSITTGSVASFMLNCIASSEWDRKTPVIVN